MEELPKYYLVLFNGVTDALDALEQEDYERAKAFLSPHSSGQKHYSWKADRGDSVFFAADDPCQRHSGPSRTPAPTKRA